MQYFVILGKGGKIAKSLYKGLNINSNEIIALNWKFIKKVLSENINLENILKSKLKIKENSCEFKVINCLKENTLEKRCQDTHLKLFEVFKGFKNKVSYIFLSTYEANKFPLTKYRKIKNNLEEIIKEKGGFIIRIGYFLDKRDLDLIKSNNSKVLIKNMHNRLILVPVTIENDLVKFINKNKSYQSQDKITCCYSKFYALSLGIQYPFVKFFDLKKKELYTIFIPLKFLSKCMLLISNIFSRLGILNNFSDLLQKPYSLHLFQNIIFNDEV